MAFILEWISRYISSDEQEDLKCRQNDVNCTLRNTIKSDNNSVIDYGITAVAIVNRDSDGDPIIVPVTRFSLREDIENADIGIIANLVEKLINAVQTPFHDISIRHYDIQFTFSGHDLFEAEECRRIVLTDQFVKQYEAETRLSMSDFRDAIGATHKDGEITPVTWENCKDYRWTDNASIIISDMTAAKGVNTKAALSTNATRNDDVCRRRQLYW